MASVENGGVVPWLKFQLTCSNGFNWFQWVLQFMQLSTGLKYVQLGFATGFCPNSKLDQLVFAGFN